MRKFLTPFGDGSLPAPTRPLQRLRSKPLSRRRLVAVKTTRLTKTRSILKMTGMHHERDRRCKTRPGSCAALRSGSLHPKDFPNAFAGTALRRQLAHSGDGEGSPADCGRKCQAPANHTAAAQSEVYQRGSLLGLGAGARSVKTHRLRELFGGSR